MDQLFFVFSKVAWVVLSPTMLLSLLVILGTLFLLAGYRQRALKVLLPTSLIYLSLMVMPVGDWLIQPLEKRIQPPQQLPSTIDGIIVLGGGEDIATTISWQQPQTGEAGDRYFGVAYLAGKYPQVPVIFTGGNNSLRFDAGETPAQLNRQLLTWVGIDEQRLIIEPQSRNTHENFLRLKTVLPKRNGLYLLVTSAYHMPRTIGVAEKQGVTVIPYPVDYRSQKADMRKINFALYEQLEKLETAWREWVGLTAYFITGKTSHWFPAMLAEALPEAATDQQRDMR